MGIDHQRAASILIRRARRRREWTQAELARRVGIPASQLCAYETAAKQPTAATLSRILAAAGVDLSARDLAAERLRQSLELEDVLGLVDAMPMRARSDQREPLPFRKLIER